MDTDKGMKRQLPPPADNQELTMDVHQSDVLNVTLDGENCLLCDGDTINMAGLTQRVALFAKEAPERRIVALNVSREASYDAYFKMQQAIVAAYRQLKCAPRISEVLEQKKGGME